MDDAARSAFLDQPLTAVLSTLNRDGSIHAAPVWYWYAEGKLFIITGRGSQKHRNAVRSGRATLCIDQRDGGMRYLTAEGSVTVIDRVTRAERLALHTRYVGAERAARRTAGNEHEEMVQLVLTPERWLGQA